MKKIKFIIILLFFLVFISGCSTKRDDSIKIISTVFPGYDFVRAIIGQDSDIQNIMLLSPGEDIHHFEPTPKDIININNCDLFIYVGGESDSWVDEILKDLDSDVKVIKMIDIVDLYDEDIVEGMESINDEDREYDEHVWTNPYNASKIIDEIYSKIALIDSSNEGKYLENKNNYVKELESIDDDFFDIVKNGKRDEIIFGDRFPLRYFVERYNLKYYAAFPGCSHDTEASAKTISFLINKVKEDKIPVIFTTELSNKKLASTISEETNSSVLEFHSCHNVSKNDFDDGVTYVDLMKRNIDVLKKALS